MFAYAFYSGYFLYKAFCKCCRDEICVSPSDSCVLVAKNCRRKFRSQTSDNMERWKSRGGKSHEVRRSQKRKSEKQEDAGARKGRKVAIHCVFQMIWGSGGLKSNLPKAAGVEPAGQMRDEKLHALVARSTFPSRNVQNTPFSDHFWKLRCRKSARSTFPSQNVQSTPFSDHFWTFRCRKMHAVVARSTFPSQKCQKLRGSNHFFDVQMSKRVHAVVARSTFPSQKCKKLRASDHLLTFRGRKSGLTNLTHLANLTNTTNLTNKQTY